MLMRSFFFASMVLLLGGCSALADSFTLEDGASHDGDISLVNGRIQIGSNCTVDGKVGNVNGRIEIGSDSSVLDISNVNGRITVGENATVAEDIANVNGRIELGAGSRIGGEVESVNGRIHASEGVVIEGQLSSVNGHIEMIGARAGLLVTNNSSITLDQGSVIDGELRVRKSQGINLGGGSPPRVVIGRDVEVAGPLTFEREVDLYVHESARVGEISGAEPTVYSGESP